MQETSLVITYVYYSNNIIKNILAISWDNEHVISDNGWTTAAFSSFSKPKNTDIHHHKFLMFLWLCSTLYNFICETVKVASYFKGRDLCWTLEEAGRNFLK